MIKLEAAFAASMLMRVQSSVHRLDPSWRTAALATPRKQAVLYRCRPSLAARALPVESGKAARGARPYQLELLQTAKTRNCIVYLDTGTRRGCQSGRSCGTVWGPLISLSTQAAERHESLAC